MHFVFMSVFVGAGTLRASKLVSFSALASDNLQTCLCLDVNFSRSTAYYEEIQACLATTIECALKSLTSLLPCCRPTLLMLFAITSVLKMYSLIR